MIQCPFCGMKWHPAILLIDNPDQSAVLAEGGQCDCGAWWIDGLCDVKENYSPEAGE